MKKLLLGLFFFGANLVYAQIAQDPITTIQTTPHKPTGFAYGDSAQSMQYGFAVHNNNTYTFYSLPNYTTIGSVTVQQPNIPGLRNFKCFPPFLITQKLFDNDNGLEFMINTEYSFIVDSIPSIPGTWHYIDSFAYEAILFNLESSTPVQKFNELQHGLRRFVNTKQADDFIDRNLPILATSDSTYKLVLNKKLFGLTSYNIPIPIEQRYFSLPGYLQPKYGNSNVLNLYRSEYNINSSMLNAFPNPSAAGMITVNYDIPIGEKAKLNLFDFHGRIMSSYDLDANLKAIQINTNNLAPGTYFYQVASPSNVSESKKLIVK